jgi:hypothetical protein
MASLRVSFGRGEWLARVDLFVIGLLLHQHVGMFIESAQMSLICCRGAVLLCKWVRGRLGCDRSQQIGRG